MARHKAKDVIILSNLTEADAALKEMCGIKRRIEAAEHAMNELIEAAKEDAAATCTPLRERMKKLEDGLLLFARMNGSALFKDRRSFSLNFGSFGYRKSTKLKTLVGVTWARVFGRLKEMGFTEAIRTKEEIDKDALHTWPKDRLELIGCRLVEEETFWVETAEAEVADQELFARQG